MGDASQSQSSVVCGVEVLAREVLSRSIRLTSSATSNPITIRADVGGGIGTSKGDPLGIVEGIKGGSGPAYVIPASRSRETPLAAIVPSGAQPLQGRTYKRESFSRVILQTAQGLVITNRWTDRAS